jgi:CubicO group peptidase (beta-lactamase class C family)
VISNESVWWAFCVASLLLVACGSKGNDQKTSNGVSADTSGAVSGSGNVNDSGGGAGQSGSPSQEATNSGSSSNQQDTSATKDSKNKTPAQGDAATDSGTDKKKVTDAGNDAAADVTKAPDASNKPKGPMTNDGWMLGKPEDYGFDKAQLEQIADQLQTASGNTRFGLVIVKEGALIFETYWNGSEPDTKHTVYSCTKSWGSTLIGIAVNKKLITVDDPVTKWVPSPAPEVGGGALIKHLLTQTAQTTPPGQAFAYNSGTIVNTLPEILEAAAKISSHSFYERFLATPLQLSMDWPPCPSGGCVGTRYGEDYIQFGDQGPNQPLQSTVRDQAKLGWLWLNDGVWNGNKLLDTEYIEAATKPSFDFQAAYGYLWWLNRKGPSSGPYGTAAGNNPEVPENMYHAVGGIGHCSVAVLRTERLVIAHIGNTDLSGFGGHLELFAPLFEL